MAWTTPATFTAGSVLTAAQLNTNVRDNTNALYSSIQRIAFTSRSTNYTVASTTVAGATDVFTGGGSTGNALTWTADGTSAYRVEYWCGAVNTATTAGATVELHLVNGTGTDLGILGLLHRGNGTYAAITAWHLIYYYTPAAGSTTLNIRAIQSVANGTLNAGAGGAGNFTPMWFSVSGPALA